MMNGPDTPTPVEIEDFESSPGLSSITGIDCNPPSAGGGLGPGPNAVGIALQTIAAKQQIEGNIGLDNPSVTGVSGLPGDIQANVPGLMSDAELKFWVQGLIADSTPYGTAPCGGGPGPGLTFGTPANPQICHVSVSTVPNALPTQIPDNSSGAGILIINDFDPRPGFTNQIQEVTNFTYEGIVVVLGDGRFRMQDSKIYGAVIQKNLKGNHSGETRLRMRGDSDICYSSAAVDLILDQRKANMIAWYEVQE